MRFLILVLVGLALGCEEKAGSLAEWVLVVWVLVMWVLVALSLGSKEKLGAIWQMKTVGLLAITIYLLMEHC